VTPDEGLLLSRLIHFAALFFAFGASFFPVYAFSGDSRRTALDYWSGTKTSILPASLIAFTSGLSWLLFTAASMAGSFSETLSPDNMTAIMEETQFGRVWTVHLALVAALCILAGLDRWGRRSFAISLAVLSAACLASLAGAGHTQEQEGLAFLVHASSDGIHLLAAGAWLGGLVALLALLSSPSLLGDRSESEIGHVLMRFSGMGYAAVALLIGTGLINAWYLAPPVSQLTVSLYGQLLITKLGLFFLMLVLAAMNRFWLVPHVQAAISDPRAKKSVFRLRYHVIGEQLLGLLVIALVSVLGTLSPSGDQ